MFEFSRIQSQLSHETYFNNHSDGGICIMDIAAIRKAYPSITALDGSWINYGLDASGNKVSIEQSKVDAARATLDAEAAAVKYKTDRTTHGSTSYASFGDQLDMLYKDIVAGKLDTTGTWATHIKNVKDSNPKPS